VTTIHTDNTPIHPSIGPHTRQYLWRAAGLIATFCWLYIGS
jgi:hypothetical protein